MRHSVCVCVLQSSLITCVCFVPDNALQVNGRARLAGAQDFRLCQRAGIGQSSSLNLQQKKADLY